LTQTGGIDILQYTPISRHISGGTMKRSAIPAVIILCASIMLCTVRVQSQSAVIIEALYATSTAMNYEKFGPHHLFDSSNDYWMTMPGAAPDEGVMIYFEKPAYISNIKVDIPSDPSIAKVKEIRLYADGKDIGTAPVGSKGAIYATVKSLYLRISQVEGFDSKAAKSELQGFDKNIQRYNSKKSAALSKITIFDNVNAPIKAIPPRLVKGSVKASSTLKPEEAYHVGYLFDSRKDSGWVEGNKGSGTGESLAFTFNDSVNIDKLKIWNGLLISDVHYKANERVKSFSFAGGSDDGKLYSLPDAQTPQTVSLAALSGKNFTFTIKDIYKGTAYKDTVISEIMFGDNGSWFTLYSDEIEKRKSALLSKVKSSILENIVDRYVGESDYNEFSSKSKSLILRSDSSFVIWIEDEDVEGNKTIRKTRVLDGFWNIITLAGDKATINIMGRNYNLAEQFAMYQGNSTSKAVSIFQDTLTVTKTGIKGAKFFGSIGL
jgi:hypothetical protein